jgi:hypothetical protein
MCRGRRARILLHLHIQLEGTVLRRLPPHLIFFFDNPGTEGHGWPASGCCEQLCPGLPGVESACAGYSDQIVTIWRCRS